MIFNGDRNASQQLADRFFAETKPGHGTELQGKNIG
jgi:hypothetical protein